MIARAAIIRDVGLEGFESSASAPGSCAAPLNAVALLERELAEQMGHAPQMTIGTYAHVIRELKREPVMSGEEQIERARQENGGRWWTLTRIEVTRECCGG